MDALKEMGQAMAAGHAQQLTVQARHLCLCGIRDVAVLFGAAGLGMFLGRLSAADLEGGWRLVPLVAGGGLIVAAGVIPAERMRFVTKSSMVVGGTALLLSTVHYTLQMELAAERSLEA